MLFRIWFLYLCKLFALGIVLALAGLAIGRREGFGFFVQTVGCILVVSLGIAGAFIGVFMLFKKRMACPLCCRQGEFVLYGKRPGVECAHCGLVYCKSPLLSFRLSVEPLETDNQNYAGTSPRDISS
jgi:hypothetical protein